MGFRRLWTLQVAVVQVDVYRVSLDIAMVHKLLHCSHKGWGALSAECMLHFLEAPDTGVVKGRDPASGLSVQR